MALRNVGGPGGNVVFGAPDAEPARQPEAPPAQQEPQKKARWGDNTAMPAGQWKPTRADPEVAREIEKLKGQLVDKTKPNDPGMAGARKLLDSLINPSAAAEVLSAGLKGPGGNAFLIDRIPGLRDMLTKVKNGQPVPPSELKAMANKVKDKMFTDKLFWENFMTNMKKLQEDAHKQMLEAAKKGGGKG